MELEREAKEGLEKVRKEWQSVNELAVKEPFKCAAAAIQTLEDGVKLLLEYGFGEIVEFNEEYTVQKAIRESSFFNVFGMNGVNNANSLYLIARYWVDKRVPADVANELCKKLNDFYATLSNAFAANCGYKPKNFQPPVEKIVDEFDAENLFEEKLFEEKKLTVEECFDYLKQAVVELQTENADVHVIVTVSPIRYRKYGYHESQLSKAILMLATDQLVKAFDGVVEYFPAYEIINDELRDYRFYKEDMLHPSDQAVEYIWQRFSEIYFGKETQEFLREWKPIKEALGHKPFNPESEEYKMFMTKTMLKVEALSKKYPTFAFKK